MFELIRMKLFLFNLFKNSGERAAVFVWEESFRILTWRSTFRINLMLAVTRLLLLHRCWVLHSFRNESLYEHGLDFSMRTIRSLQRKGIRVI